MTPKRWPITQLISAIKTRIDADLDVDIFSFVPQSEGKPYAEIGSIAWADGSWKNKPCTEVVVTFNAYSDDQNMQKVNAVLGTMVRALTRTPTLEMADNFDVIDHKIEGSGEVVKEADEFRVYWRGTFRVRWKIAENSTAGPAGGPAH